MIAKLLVSVRSAVEARAAVRGGAAIIDVKEPDRGPLGRADVTVWRDVIAAVGDHQPVSVALGELSSDLDSLDPRDFDGIAFRKVGLAGVGDNWREEWKRLRDRLATGPAWVAVVYADWRSVGAPDPSWILDEALEVKECVGVLVDTYDKTRPSPVDPTWRTWFERAKQGQRFTALAGSLDAHAIRRLASLSPDIVAVRGAACHNGNRNYAVDCERVAALSAILSQIKAEAD